MHWHEFGDLEGPGWAANAVGGAHLLHNWGIFGHDQTMVQASISLLMHVLEDGFIDPVEGFIWPYYDLSVKDFCWNYTHGSDWLCPGSLAKMAVQLLDFAADLPDDLLADKMNTAAVNLSEWLLTRVDLLDNGWLPRRITPQGKPYPYAPGGHLDSIYDHSGDGLFILQLWSMLAARGHTKYRDPALKLGQTFVDSGGFYGSINHDTYDSHESVAYACAFRILRQSADLLGAKHWGEFAYQKVLPALSQFRLLEDKNNIPTKGLIWMEESWNTAYLWENAEVSQAYLEAWADTGDEEYRNVGLEILQAIVVHHHGEYGFLTEGVDWDNHVGQQHHIDGKLYEDIQYTEPFLNNLHFLLPTLYYFAKTQKKPSQIDTNTAIRLVTELSANARRSRA